MEKYFSNFQCYIGKTKQRCAIFSREKEGKLEIFILKVAAKDQLNRDLARAIYNKYLQDGVFINKKQEKIIIHQHFINTKPKSVSSRNASSSYRRE